MAIFTALGTALGVSAATAAAGVGAIATVAGVVGQHNARKKQAGIQEKAEELRLRRERVGNIRRAQAARARAMVTSQGSGAIGGSGALGGIGAISSQTGAASGASTQVGSLNTAFNRAQQSAGNFAALSQIGSSLFKFGASRGGLQPFFGSNAGEDGTYPSLDYQETQQLSGSFGDGSRLY